MFAWVVFLFSANRGSKFSVVTVETLLYAQSITRLSKLNYTLFFIFFGITFISLIFKMLNAPITHDETLTIINAENNGFWEIMMFPDPAPNNHILNTVITKMFISVFGTSIWSVRLPNVLFFLFYAYAVFRLTRFTFGKNSTLFVPATLFFIISPYLLDFFSLCRGYGMACSLCTLSVAFLMEGFQLNKNKLIWMSFGTALFSAYANFSLIFFLGAIGVFGFIYFLKNQSALKNIAILSTISIAFILLIIIPVLKMRTTGQFEEWEKGNFFSNTLYPLIRHSTYDTKFLFLQLTELLSVLTVAIVFFNLINILLHRKNLMKPYSIATLVLVLTVIINHIICWNTDTPFLNARMSLFYLPLFSIVFVTSIQHYSPVINQRIKPTLSSLMAIIILIQVSITYKPNSIREWSFDSNTFAVIDYINEHKTSTVVSLEADWLFHPSLSFHLRPEGNNGIKLHHYHKDLIPETTADFYYIFKKDYSLFKSNFNPVLKFENDCWLLKRKS